MQYRTLIDNVAAKEWGLTINQAYILDWLIQFQLDAQKLVIDGDIYFFASRNKAVAELPLLTDKADTVYRYYKQLEDFGLVAIKKIDNKDYVNITSKCSSTWGKWKGGKIGSDLNPTLGNISDHSDLNPKTLGFESENNSDLNPTYYTINTNHTTIDKTTNAGGEENFEQQEEYIQPPMPNTILSEMTNYYIKLNPQYKKIATPKVDNPAIRQIAERITGNKMFHLQPEIAMKKWRAFCSVVLTNEFYCQKPLKTICNNIQTFLQDIEKAENGHYTPPPSKNNSVQMQFIPQKVVLDGKKGYYINNGAPIRL
jgi:hypothetical protein